VALDRALISINLLFLGLRIGRVPLVFLASIPVAFAAPQDAAYVWILIVIVGLVINRFVPEPDEPDLPVANPRSPT
jgi:hypothetical protein